MASSRPPTSRIFQASFSHRGHVYVWGGLAEEPGRDVLKHVDRFDTYLEKWDDHHALETTRIPHPGQFYAAYTSYECYMYLYGGCSLEGEHNSVISRLNVNTLEWTSLCASSWANGGPKKKSGLRMMYLKNNRLVMIGGYGPYSVSTDTQSTFVTDEKHPDHGWSNEVHIFHIGGKLYQ